MKFLLLFVFCDCCLECIFLSRRSAGKIRRPIARHHLRQRRHLHPGHARARSGHRGARWAHRCRRFQRRHPQAEGRSHSGRRSRWSLRHARLQRRPRPSGRGRPRAAERRPARRALIAGDAAAHRGRLPRPRLPANGWWAAVGTRRCGRTRHSPPARISMPLPAVIPRCSAAWTATSPSPTPRR